MWGQKCPCVLITFYNPDFYIQAVLMLRINVVKSENYALVSGLEIVTVAERD